jgi:hypothetical protein
VDLTTKVLQVFEQDPFPELIVSLLYSRVRSHNSGRPQLTDQYSATLITIRNNVRALPNPEDFSLRFLFFIWPSG